MFDLICFDLIVLFFFRERRKGPKEESREEKVKRELSGTNGTQNTDAVCDKKKGELFFILIKKETAFITRKSRPWFGRLLCVRLFFCFYALGLFFAFFFA